MLRVIRRFAVLLINIVVLLVVLIAVEVGFRVYANVSERAGASAMAGPDNVTFQFYPYVMTGQVRNAHYHEWYDSLRRKSVPADVTTNNVGFPDRQNFSISKPYAKQPNEKVVLFTGGSTAFGIGASTNAAITHEVLQRLLNAAQSDVHYTVINLAQGGWIAQQDVIALDIWGRLFQPDWVIVLDGANDASVGCAYSQGTGNPTYYQLMDALVDGYVGEQARAVFYRGAWENQLIKYSAAYRGLTRQKYIPPPAHVNAISRSSLLQVVTPTLLSEVKDQLDFYMLSEVSMLERFHDAKFILSTQPTQHDPRSTLADFYRDADGYAVDVDASRKFAEELDNWLQSFKPDEKYCLSDPDTGPVAVRYMMAMSAIRLAALAEDYASRHHRDVEYYNTGLLYPKDAAQRDEFFIDRWHLNDMGLESLARFYAYRILRRDFPDRDWSAQRPTALWFH
jgi:hypothetical protein